jgi:hypothetical protein
MNKDEFSTWLQGFILGGTGVELNEAQVSLIKSNLNKVKSDPDSTPVTAALTGTTPWNPGGTGPSGEIYRC